MIIISLTSILLFSYNILFAADPSIIKEKIFVTKSEILVSFPKEITSQLAPATPSEATFEDPDKIGTTEINGDKIRKMSPVTPKEASFEEVFSRYSKEPYILLPLTPKEATFEDSTGK